MRVWRLALATCGVLALAACGTSNSQGADRLEPVRALLSADAMMFSSFDADSDFNVTMAEVETGVARELARADSNSDGSIGPIEYQNWATLVLGGSLTPPYRLDFDRNVDNIISAEEFRNELVARAQGYDTDENGAVTRAEFVRQLNQARPAIRRETPRPDGQP